jgi:hypothetical protein
MSPTSQAPANVVVDRLTLRVTGVSDADGRRYADLATAAISALPAAVAGAGEAAISRSIAEAVSAAISAEGAGE